MRILKCSLVASLALTLLLAAPVWAQETGSISGTITDPDGAPLPGVAVTIEGGTAATKTVYSQANGVYRFPVVPPSFDYSLTFQLEGFKTIIQTALQVRVGGNTAVSVGMELSTVEETVTVTGTSPIVDVKKTNLGTNITQEYMQNIPSARDPWVMLEHTGGVQINKQNVGGSESGQQSSFTANGSNFSDNVWTYDGAEITDMSAAGASPMYYDFDAFEEISITTGGNDPSIATGGIRINFVTKRGGNSWRGSARFYLTDGDLQADNVGDPKTGDLSGGNFSADELFPGYIGNSIDQIKDFGGELGGPVLRDKFFVWGAYGRSEIETQVGISPDNTQLTNYHAKGNWHISDQLVANYTFIRADKTKQGRGASASRPPLTTWNQEGPSPIHTGKVQYTINDNHYVEGLFNYTGLGFSLEPQGGREVQTSWDLGTGLWGRSFGFFATERPLYNARLDGNSYIAGSSVDHELKYGYSYRNAETSSVWGFGGGAIDIFVNGAAAEAWLIQNDIDNYEGTRNSVYLGDTISAGRLTINAGLRYDNQTSKSLASASTAHPLAPDTFPANSFDGFDPDFAWNSLSPRLGLTYDLSGDSTTIVRLTGARYYSQMGNGELHLKSTTAGREIDFEWTDLNGDGSAQPDELGAITFISGGWDPANPTAPSPNIIDETDAPYSDELIIGVEHEINPKFGVGANFIYKKNQNFTWNIRDGENANAFWEQVTVSGVTAFQPVGPRSIANRYQQQDGYERTYTGVELFLTKRFADKWMANASFVYANPKQKWDSSGVGYTDPTNIAVFNDEIVGAGSRTGSFFGASRWYLKGSGMYQFGSGFSLGTFFQIREGNVIAPFVRTANRAFGSGRANAIQDTFGSERLSTYWNLDLRAEKTFDLQNRGRLHLIVDAFNLTNNDIVLATHNQINSSNFDKIREVQQGRTIRVGARLVLR